jgi:diguanylate cyclase
VAERVRQSVAAAHLDLPDGSQVHVQVSLGVTSTSGLPNGFPSLDTLLQQADQALYRAKALGRNRVYVYNGLDTTRPGV